MIGQTPYKAGQIITDRGNNAKITMAIDKLSSSKNPVIESIRTAEMSEETSDIASSRAAQASEVSSDDAPPSEPTAQEENKLLDRQTQAKGGK